MGAPTKTVEMNCIVCPLGCLGKVTIEDETVKEADGFTCERGLKYAQEEITDPKRMLTTTVRIKGGVLSFLPVVSSRPIPKKLIMQTMRLLKDVTATAPIKEGAVICGDIFGLGIDIVASRDLSEKSGEKALAGVGKREGV